MVLLSILEGRIIMSISALPNLGLGLGLRHQHFNHVLEHKPNVDWFEIISENFIADYGWCRNTLLKIREHYPIVMHGVSMSIGSCDPLNWQYLTDLKALSNEVQPKWISDHLCWTGIQNTNTHDLLPVALTEQSLDHICERIDKVQDFLQRPLILENPSTYLSFNVSTIKEWEFLNAMADKTGCGLLIDVNNIYVSARNHGFNPIEYIDCLQHSAIAQIHIAGHTDLGDHCIDTHDQPVSQAVWSLYARLNHLTGGVSTLLEWDANIPDFPTLHAELLKTQSAIESPLPEAVSSKSIKQDTRLSNPIHFMVGDRL